MKVFISWSGPMSREISSVLRKYLPCMIQGIDAFMSKHDLESGVRWSLQLAKELDESKFGLICLTPDNLNNPWILFEAGALTKHLEGRACGLLLNGLTPTDVAGPLSQFQNRVFTKPDFWALLQDINDKLTTPLGAHQLEMIFEKWWPDLERECQDALKRTLSTTAAPRRDQKEIVEEILSKVRGIERMLDSVFFTAAPTSLRAMFDNVWSRLTDNQRRLLAELITPAATKVVVNTEQILRHYPSEDLRRLEEMGLLMRSGDGVAVFHDAFAGYVRDRVNPEK